MTNSGGQVVKVRGADRLALTMRAAADSLADMQPANREVSDLMARRASSNAPRRSGALAASVQPRATATVATVISGTGIRYAGVIEGGWRARGIRPTHFTARAVEETAPAAIEVYEQAVDKAISGIKGA